MLEKNNVEITCTLEQIRFRKEETGFLIGSFLNEEGNWFAGIGTLSNPQIEMKYKLTGGWEENSRYGAQFKFRRFETIQPTDPIGIFKYIVRICKFVGPAKANEIINRYGDKTLEVMKSDPEAISQIKGITLDRAKSIQQTLLRNEAMEKLSIELEAYLDVTGMLKSLVGRLIERYKYNAAEFVKENPYILTEFSGVGFNLADRVAMKNKYPRDSINRKKAATLYVMSEHMKAGNVWMSDSKLLDGILDLIQVDNVEEGIDALVSNDTLAKRQDSKPGKNSFAMGYVARNESIITSVVASLLKEGPEWI